MNTKLIIIIGFSYLYGFFEIFINLKQRSKSKVTSCGDKGSLWMLYILITIWIYFFIFELVVCDINDDSGFIGIYLPDKS